MIVKVKLGSDKKWGFLEKYESYWYKDRGYVKALVGLSMNKTLSKPYVYRGGDFVGLDIIDNEVGVDRYVKAKKPFYSMLSGGFIVVLKSYIDLSSGKGIYIPDKSSYEVYVVNKILEGGNEVALKRVIDVPEAFRDIVEEPLRVLAESMGDREKFLKSRLNQV